MEDKAENSNVDIDELRFITKTFLHSSALW